jgi:hypothetical protein
MSYSALGHDRPFSEQAAIATYLLNKEEALDRVVIRDSIKINYGDVNYDDTNDIVLIYTLAMNGENGNFSSTFIGVFTASDKTSSYEFIDDIEVGSKTSRAVVFNSIKNGMITIDTIFMSRNESGDWDAFCCLSGEGTAYYTLSDNKLVELNTSP